MAEEDSGSGLFYSVRRLASTFLGILQNRLEILSLEAATERSRLLAILIGTALVAAFAFMGMIVITFLLVVSFWAQAVWVLLGLAVFYVAGAAAAFFYVRRRMKEPLFPETVAQLEKDRQWIFPQK
jgi:uncharacterized membrane protein YqjE